LEEKDIPYRVGTVPLNAYGDKLAWFTRNVDRGQFPAVELDGKVHKESLAIMQLLDEVFSGHGPIMCPCEEDDGDAATVEELFRLEKEFQSNWFSLVFYPVEGEDLHKSS
jgi:glutathione S-transferase